jgi:hypothetical protein
VAAAITLGGGPAVLAALLAGVAIVAGRPADTNRETTAPQ